MALEFEDQSFEEDEILAFNGLEEEEEEVADDFREELQDVEVMGDTADDRKQSPNVHNSPSSSSSFSGKLFVGGLSWDTTKETFSDYFSQYGEVQDSVIMTDRYSGRPRGFGFVTFTVPAVADAVLELDHVIDGRAVEVKRTVPRKELGVGGVVRSKKIFVGGLPPYLTEDELQEYFSVYGVIVDHQIMLDHRTGRSRGFGFVTFESEDAVKRVFSEGRTHEIGGKQVEIKVAVPRPGGDYGRAAKSSIRIDSGPGGHGTHHGSEGGYNGKVSRGYGDYGSYCGYPAYGVYAGGYMGSAVGLYGAYGMYGFGVGDPLMYAGGGYGGNGFPMLGAYGGAAMYSCGIGSFGSGKWYGNGVAVSGNHGNDREHGGTPNGGSERYHPYRK
uniref:Heterogeneous nuclear ribonucleoprotein 1 n=2 Tax=Rhizophora mucronata TaxID=61149 RepID=A0A2P2IKR2_RHIMU